MSAVNRFKGAKLVDIAQKIRGLRQRACEDVIEIGRLLLKAKKQIGHGQWGRWLTNEFAWSQDTAERFINVAAVFGQTNSATLRNMDVSLLYELARPSTPQEARDAVLDLIKDETPPTLADARKIIRNVKPAAEPQPQPKPNPKPRQAALQDQFRTAFDTLQSLSTKPAHTFAGIVPPGDLEMLSNFLRQIACAIESEAA
jgi:hypothetical protein